MEKKKAGDRSLSAAGYEGLDNCLCRFVKRQILSEHTNKFRGESSFVFGHTHKPFEERVAYQELKRQVSLYNTGGRVVETIDDNPLHGASMVCLDSDERG